MRKIQRLWSSWKRIAAVIGNFQAQVIFTLFYFLLLWPVGITSRLLSDPLKLKKRKNTSNFSNWIYEGKSLEQAGKQY